jgi:dihydroneopterin aldolase
MEFYAYHGCFPEEKVIGTHFKVDAVIHCNFMEAAQQDDLEKSINYQKVYALIKEEMAISSHIIEHVCLRIMKRLKTRFPEILQCEITVYKLNPAIGGKTEWVAVTMSDNANTTKSKI